MDIVEALWDGQDEGREERVKTALAENGIDEARRTMVLTQILPMMPELKRRKKEAGGTSFDFIDKLATIVSNAVEGKFEFPDTVNAVLTLIRRKIELSYT